MRYAGFNLKSQGSSCSCIFIFDCLMCCMFFFVSLLPLVAKINVFVTCTTLRLQKSATVMAIGVKTLQMYCEVEAEVPCCQR